MDKYIGNKKSILNDIEEFIKSKGVSKCVFIDAFSGTTNVGQYFKQLGYSVISNDINSFSFVLGKAYIENNEFPKFDMLLNKIKDEGYEVNRQDILSGKEYINRKIKTEKIFPVEYYNKTNYSTKIEPLLFVLNYLNNLPINDLLIQESLFYDYFTTSGEKSIFKSSRGLLGKRNYFSSESAKKLGKIMHTIKMWNDNNLLLEMELYILIACVIEEVTLNANVSGTFHDFNRHKLYPNAATIFSLKPIMLNVVESREKYHIFKEDANALCFNSEFNQINVSEGILYIDPPYNFRQYSAYYHMLNFIADYINIKDIIEYANGFEFVRGQNMKNNINSQYCYKKSFISSLEDLVQNIKAKHILISYYDENNHWNHGKKNKTFEGRDEILKIFERNIFLHYDKEPYIIERKNYQSQNGGSKKKINELLFYARR